MTTRPAPEAPAIRERLDAFLENGDAADLDVEALAEKWKAAQKKSAEAEREAKAKRQQSQDREAYEAARDGLQDGYEDLEAIDEALVDLAGRMAEMIRLRNTAQSHLSSLRKTMLKLHRLHQWPEPEPAPPSLFPTIQAAPHAASELVRWHQQRAEIKAGEILLADVLTPIKELKRNGKATGEAAD